MDQAFEQTSFGPSPDVSANPIDRVANQLTAAFAATKTDEVSESEVEKAGVVASAEAIDTAFNQASVDLDPDEQKSPTNDDDLDFQADFGTKMDDQYPSLDFDDESYSYWLPLESINDFSKRNNQLEMPRELDDATLSAIRQIVRSSTANGFSLTAGRTLEMAASRLSFIAVHDVPLPQQMRPDVANPGTDSLAVRLKSVVMMTNSTTPFTLANNTTINPELLDRILASLIDESVDNTDAEVQQAGVAVPNVAYPIAAVITTVAVSRYRNRKLGHATDWRHQSKGN